MEWLKEFENERGVGYLVVITGSIGPSVLAIFLLEPERFDASDLGKILLLAACAGIVAVALCVVAALFIEMREVLQNPGQKDRAQSMRIALVMGGAMALILQLAMLAPATYQGWAFSKLLAINLWACGGFAAITMASLIRAIGHRKDK